MPDDLETLGSLISEVRHTRSPRSPYRTLFMTDATGYLTLSRGWTSTPAGEGPLRLPSEEDLTELLARLVPQPPEGTPSVDAVVADLEHAAITLASSDLVPAVNAIIQLGWPDLWTVIERLASRGPTLDGQTYLEIIEGASRDLPGLDPRTAAAMLAGLLRRGGRTLRVGAIPGWARLTSLLNLLDPLPQLEVLGHLGVPPAAAEGAMAMLFSEAMDAGLDSMFTSPPARRLTAAITVPEPWLARLSQLLGGINRHATSFLDWANRGNQANPLYIGNQVHEAIANFYRLNHLEHTTSWLDPWPTAIWTNSEPVGSILRVLEGKFRFMGSPLSAALHLARPDIFEFGFAHDMPPGWVYEIKPASSGAALATYEAQFYAVALTLCDINVVPGPAGAVGTVGVVPIPQGWAAFISPIEGVIVYRILWASEEAIAQRAQVPWWRQRRELDLRARLEQALRDTGAPAAVIAMVGMMAVVITVLLAYGWVIILV